MNVKRVDLIVEIGLLIGGTLIQVIQNNRKMNKIAEKAAEIVLEKQAG